MGESEPTWFLEPGTDKVDPGVVGTLILIAATLAAVMLFSVHTAHKQPAPAPGVVACNPALQSCRGQK